MHTLKLTKALSWLKHLKVREPSDQSIRVIHPSPNIQLHSLNSVKLIPCYRHLFHFLIRMVITDYLYKPIPVKWSTLSPALLHTTAMAAEDPPWTWEWFIENHWGSETKKLIGLNLFLCPDCQKPEEINLLLNLVFFTSKLVYRNNRHPPAGSK